MIMTFQVCNLRSKLPHLHSAYVVSVPSQSHTTVTVDERLIARAGGKLRHFQNL